MGYKIYFGDVPVILSSKNDDISNDIFLDDEALLQEFKKKFKTILAGGGIVFNEKDEILMIFRRGKWDLPKGKMDDGENIEACAVREVEEECGIKIVNNSRPFIVTYHVYDEYGKHILKETHWYLMNADSNQVLVPQTEEEITAIEWVSLNNLNEKLKNTYAQIRDIISLVKSKRSQGFI